MDDKNFIKLPIDNEILNEYSSNNEDFFGVVRYFYDLKTGIYTFECCFNDMKKRDFVIDCSKDKDLLCKLASLVWNVNKNSTLYTENGEIKMDDITKTAEIVFDNNKNDFYASLQTIDKSFSDKMFRIFDSKFKELSQTKQKEKD